MVAASISSIQYQTHMVVVTASNTRLVTAMTFLMSTSDGTRLEDPKSCEENGVEKGWKKGRGSSAVLQSVVGSLMCGSSPTRQ